MQARQISIFGKHVPAHGMRLRLEPGSHKSRVFLEGFHRGPR